METTNSSESVSLNRICLAGAVAFAVAAAVMASGCSTAGGVTRAADVRVGHVSWHARLGADAPAESLQASNL